MFTVTLANARTFRADPDVSILDAARAQGVTLEYSCRNGRCGACRAVVLAGATRRRQDEPALMPEDRESGAILTCCRAADSDLVLDIADLPELAAHPARILPCRIDAIDFPSPDVAVVRLRLPPGSAFRALPGQYVDVLAAGVRRPYSLAAPATATEMIELHVARVADGVLSRYWFERAKVNDLLRLEGPLGTFFLRRTLPPVLVFLATGTGIAPVKAILAQLAAEPDPLPRIALYWGNRTPDRFYWTPQAPGSLSYRPVLSGNSASWSGARGHVQDVLIDDGFKPEETMVYACGSLRMIDEARDRLLGLGLAPHRFLSDAFVEQGLN